LNLWNAHGHDLCDYYLSDARTVKEGCISRQWIRKNLKKLDKEIDIRYVNKFLGLLAFEIWYRMFVTREITNKTTL
ncbi:MAG: asparagine synthase, partial [Ignavibacteria bacterium]